MMLIIKETDGLRGIAGFAVVFFHLLSEYARRYGRIEHDIFRIGSYGVPLFFVISSFVIFMSLIYLMGLFIHLVVEKKTILWFEIKQNLLLSKIEVKFKKVITRC